MKLITATRKIDADSLQRSMVAFIFALLLAACEAPLNLEAVEEGKASVFRRYDMFQAAAHRGDEVAVVSSLGAVVVSADGGTSWQRIELPGRPALIDVTACASGEFFALDSERRVWRRVPGSWDWTASVIDTPEDTLSIHCAPNGRVWVSASLSTLFWSDNELSQWHEFTLEEDLQFTTVRFVDELNGFALGEFGTVVTSADGGDSWETRDPIPNEFYPMAADFLDARTGWVGGLDGIIWHTTDGAQSWQRQQSVTSAPIYNIYADDPGVFAVGGSAKLVELVDGQWREFKEAPRVLAYLRGLDVLDNGSLLVAGGGGTVETIPLDNRAPQGR